MTATLAAVAGGGAALAFQAVPPGRGMRAGALRRGPARVGTVGRGRVGRGRRPGGGPRRPRLSAPRTGRAPLRNRPRRTRHPAPPAPRPRPSPFRPGPLRICPGRISPPAPAGAAILPACPHGGDGAGGRTPPRTVSPARPGPDPSRPLPPPVSSAAGRAVSADHGVGVGYAITQDGQQGIHGQIVIVNMAPRR